MWSTFRGSRPTFITFVKYLSTFFLLLFLFFVFVLVCLPLISSCFMYPIVPKPPRFDLSSPARYRHILLSSLIFLISLCRLVLSLHAEKRQDYLAVPHSSLVPEPPCLAWREDQVNSICLSMTETATLIMSSVSTGRCNHLRHGTILSIWRNFWSALFTVTAFGGASAETCGTTVKFNPPFGEDTISKHGFTTAIKTRHLCITAMKVYENKSLEVRYEALCVDRHAFVFCFLDSAVPVWHLLMIPLV